MAKYPKTTQQAIASIKPAGAMAGKIPLAMQMEGLECAASCFQMVCSYYGKWISSERARKDCSVSRDGASALNVVKAARQYGFDAAGYDYDVETLSKQAIFPCIVNWGATHFLVVRGFKGSKVYVSDPSDGEYEMSIDEFRAGYGGTTLILTPNESFEPEGAPASVRDFISDHLAGFRKALVLLAISVAVISLLEMIAPLMSQIFLDDLIIAGNPNIRVPFFLLLGFVCIVQVAITVFNQIYLYRVEGRLASRSTASFVWKLLHLPISFFQQRQSGDLVNRAVSNKEISNKIVSDMAPLMIMIGMMVVYFIIMCAYSTWLALVGLLCAVLKLLSAVLIAKRKLNLLRVHLKNDAMLDASTISGITMIESIKAAGNEQGFFERWSGYQAEANAHGVELNRVNAYLGIIPSVISTIADVSIFVGSVFLVMQGEFQAGMVLALQTYLSQFMAPVTTLVESVQSLQEARVAMERTRDIHEHEFDRLCMKGEPTEIGGMSKSRKASNEVLDDSALSGIDIASSDEELHKLSGMVDVKGATYGYNISDEPLLNDVSIHVEPGGSLGIVGPSGCGKSTLLKLITGLARPWSGSVELDGKPLHEIPKEIRTGSVAAIDQDIVMFNDTIANNIRLWDDTIEDFEMILAARDAQIHDEIMKHDGGYEHILSEGGSDFSGGQRQRLEIARALAQDPTVLVMDEATSSLDVQAEAQVLSAIRGRGITTIIVAHRITAIKDCDEIIVMEKGKIMQRGSHAELMEDPDGLYARMLLQD